MADTSEQQINCIFQTEAQVPIYDQDNLVGQEKQKQKQKCKEKQMGSAKQIVLSDKVENYDPELLRKIDQELEHSKENFFKVKVIKKQATKKQNSSNTNNVKTLKRIENLIQKNPNCILKQGYLDKKTDGFIFRWKTRYFALTSEKLYFFQDNKKQKVIGCVNLKVMPVQLKKQDNEITLDFLGQCENMIIQSQSKKQMQQWLHFLSQVINYHKKQKKLLLKTMIKPLYSCLDSITQKQFQNTSQTGDILLFYTRHTGAKIQRVLTNSDFDHVAMVVKFGKNQVMVFESNQTFGVSIYDWGQYIRVFNLYQKVTIRKLFSARKKQYHQILLNFVKKNLGKKYQMNAMKFLRLESDFNWDQVKQDQTRGFFCSQLIAKAYKSIGLIDQKKYSARFWPVDFSQKGEMALKNGAYFGSEQSIILNKHVKNVI